jgi:hypothetical protein
MDPEFMKRAVERREVIQPYIEAGFLIGSTLLAYSSPQVFENA